MSILLLSHSGFSDTEANGITMKNLLDAWDANEKAEFYCNVSAPDYTAAHRYFRVTDVQMIKAFFGKKSQHEFVYEPNAQSKKETTPKASAKKIPSYLKKQKYNFWIKWLREWMWRISPWGHKKLRRWVAEIDPEVVFYMVGESLFMDKTVLKLSKHKPLVLYHCEAYRIIDLKERKGLERAYYRKTQKLYAKLNQRASLVIYNSPMLQAGYEAKYDKTCKAMIAYNSAQAHTSPYEPKDTVTVSYFGNLGVGRAESLLTVAKCLQELGLALDVYGAADAKTEAQLQACDAIRFHGFLQKEALQEVLEKSDILLHAESFDAEIAKKLRYAFSTKIAQCLCAGRCFVSFAPASIASTQYLKSVGIPVATDVKELKALLQQLVSDDEKRTAYARHALAVGLANHQQQSQQVRKEIGAILNEM